MIKKYRNIFPTRKLERFSMEPKNALERTMDAIDSAISKVNMAINYFAYTKEILDYENYKNFVEDMKTIKNSLEYLYNNLEQWRYD